MIITRITPDFSDKNTFVENTFVENTFVENTLKVFISYFHGDKRIAGAIKKALHYYDIDAFLAHEDIQVSEEWQKIILDNLRKCDIFIAIISENFKQSIWTNQEIGFASCQKKMIVPISIDGNLPYGLIYNYQSLTNFKCKEQINHDYPDEKIIDCKESIFEIIKIIASKSEFKGNIKKALIEKLCDFKSYNDAEKYFELLNQLQPFSKKQINEIIDKSIRHEQIHKAHKCQIILKDLIEIYKTEIDDENKLALSKLMCIWK